MPSIILEIQGKYDKDDPYSPGTHILVNIWNKQTNKKVLQTLKSQEENQKDFMTGNSLKWPYT